MTGSTRSSEGLDVRRRKILFRSWHRGMRETDLIMGRFADAEIEKLDDAVGGRFRAADRSAESRPHAWVSGELDIPPNYDTTVLRKLQATFTSAAEER